jgi:nicotinate phosphoribosyltransferase
VLSFPSELEAYRRLQELLGERTVYLIDTYDTLEGARRAASLGQPLWGVRLDSGNLDELSRQVRRILDGAGFPEAKIMATGDLNEHKILEFVAAGAPIDTFGVGTELATSFDAPSHGAIYKLVELRSGENRRGVAKFSEDKATLPGAKQVFRYPGYDLLGLHDECPPSGHRVLLQPVILRGQLVAPLPTAAAAREHCQLSVSSLPKKLRSLFQCDPPWPVRLSPALEQLRDQVSRS